MSNTPPSSPFSGGLTPPDFPISLNNGTPGFPGNIDPITGFPIAGPPGPMLVPATLATNPAGPVLPANNPIDPSISTSFMAGWAYQGVPYTGDSNRTITPIGTPSWFTKGSLHRAKWSRQGPFVDPSGMFEVPANYALVYWEIKQGTPQYTPPPSEIIPTIFAILPIDLVFVDPPGANSKPLLYAYVEPDLSFVQPQDDIAVWFAFNRPAHIIGAFRVPDDVNLGFGRNNNGGIGRQQ